MIDLESLARRVREARAERAKERQLHYQEVKAQKLEDVEAITRELEEYAAHVRHTIERTAPLPERPRVLDVGSGPHGLVFFLGYEGAIGVDPLAEEYARLFPEWQRRAETRACGGEALPFDDASFDLVISDNVIDHAERPEGILREIARVLRPGGVLYFTVNVHHRVYGLASAVYAGMKALGVPLEVGPFADHTVHLSPAEAKAMLAALPFDVLREDLPIAEALAAERRVPPRHPGDLLKRVLFKNVRYEVIAKRR